MNPTRKKLEFEGKTVKDAVETALKRLGVCKEDIKITILCEEKKGLFGMEGEKLAKIRVELK